MNYFMYVVILFGYRDVDGISTLKDRTMATIMIVLAVVTSGIAISTNLYSLARN